MDLISARNAMTSGKTIYDLELRVTYYARVSTDKDVQLNSLDNQIFYFENRIRDNPNWTFVPGYVDEGISGKNAEKRASFMRMIRDAKRKQFDLILTKEISRFSRSTLDSIMYTQQLLTAGVGVFFESDNINTLQPDSELRLTIMASMAQEEVRKLSERMRFGYKRSIEKGHVLGQKNILGYDKKDCKLTVNEEEAKVVRRMFEIYCEGRVGVRGVARQLEREGFLSKNTGKMYNAATVTSVLRNPKYKGFYCSGRQVTIDYRDPRKYYMPRETWNVYRDENIPAIVSEEMWDRANRLLQERGQRCRDHAPAFQNRYSFSGKIICADHGTSYHRHIYRSKKNGEQEVWNCKLYRQKGKDEGCDSPTIYSHELHTILNSIYQTVYQERGKAVDSMLEVYRSLAEAVNHPATIAEADERIKLLERKKSKLLELYTEDLISKEEFKDRNAELTEELTTWKTTATKAQEAIEMTSQAETELKVTRQKLTEHLDNRDYFSAELSTELLDKIVVTKIDGNKRHVQLDIYLTLGKHYRAERRENDFLSLYEMGISQAQVSRLEKSAMKKIKKQL